MAQHDVVVIGAGHNGLIVACYLAKAGLDVCVVEMAEKVGGGVVTRELTVPGFKHDPAATMQATIQANPLIHRDELGLKSRYGLKYIFPDPQLAVVFPDEKALVVYRDIDKTCESIAQFSQRDAEIYPRFCEASVQILKAGGVPTFSPAAPFGQLVSSMDGSDGGREFLRVILSSTMDMAEEWFESEQMKIALARFASEVMIGPREKGTGAYIFGFPHFHRWGVAIPEGGSGALTEALAACLRDNGGSIRLSSPVKTIKVVGGEAKAVVLRSGEEIHASRAIVSNLNVKQLFLEMLKGEELPTGFQDRVRRIKPSSFSAFNQALALNEAPKYKVGGDVDRTAMVEVSPFMEDFSRSFEEFAYGIPASRMPLVVVATLADPLRAPEGKHTMYLYHYEPYKLKDGGAASWDDRKQEVADAVLDEVRRHTTNMGPENILGRWVSSPLDFERSNPAFVDGDIHHIAAFLNQFYTNRPLPGWGQYRTPVKRLYMTGGSTHPGAGVTGGGRASVQVIMEDMGIDFKKVVAR
ncbi:MAG: phytoene desaturase family protein [Dehalococcoidia bacterium]